MSAARSLSFLALSAALLGGGTLLAAASGDDPDGLAGPAPALPDAPARPGIAVVELFTSQGCSSCPPADAVLAALADRAEKCDAADEFVLPILWHVDDWDRLGWTDPYGAPVHSARQRNDARTLKTGRVHAPQVVVNGAAETVGSRSESVQKRIDAALARPAAGTVSVRVLPSKYDANLNTMRTSCGCGSR